MHREIKELIYNFFTYANVLKKITNIEYFFYRVTVFKFIFNMEQYKMFWCHKEL